jgi:flagellar biosynthesis protein FlgN
MQPPPAAHDRAAFAQTLGAELTAYVELCELLRAEQNSLERGDVDRLQQLTELKARQVERLATLGAARVAFLRAARLSTDTKGMEAWLESHAGTQRQDLTRIWQRLLDTAREARALNDLNGGLVSARLGHSQAALAALQGAGRPQLVYGPDGRVRY